MLPPMLTEIKNKLVSKGYSNRSTREDNLLAELERLDLLINEESRVRKSILSEAQITSGPGDKCSCCGR